SNNSLIPSDNILIPLENPLIPSNNPLIPLRNLLIPLRNFLTPPRNLLIPLTNRLPSSHPSSARSTTLFTASDDRILAIRKLLSHQLPSCTAPKMSDTAGPQPGAYPRFKVDAESGDSNSNAGAPMTSKAPNSSADTTLAVPASSRKRRRGDDSDDEMPLKPDAPWPSRLTRRLIPHLAGPSATAIVGDAATIPTLTVRDVTLNSLMSVRFLRDLGDKTLNKHSIHIDDNGYLKVGREPVNGHTEDFIKALSRIDDKVELRKQHEPNGFLITLHDKIGAYLLDHNDIPDLSAVRLDDFCRCLCELQEPDLFSLKKVRETLQHCREAIKDLGEKVTICNAVKADLLDYGSTAIGRWTKLKRLVKLPDSDADSDKMLANNPKELAESIGKVGDVYECHRGQLYSIELEMAYNLRTAWDLCPIYLELDQVLAGHREGEEGL
ncbi:hypothetical protein B0T21DRAFT_442146, partial [Apiosordaria backusii]